MFTVLFSYKSNSKVIPNMIAFGFSLLFSVIGPKGLHHFLKQSGLKLKLICNLVSFLVSNSVLIGSLCYFPSFWLAVVVLLWLRFFTQMKSMLNPFTPEISPLILLTICHKNLYNVNLENLVLDQLKPPYIYFLLFSSLVCLILHWQCQEKFSLGHSWKLKG